MSEFHGETEQIEQAGSSLVSRKGESAGDIAVRAQRDSAISVLERHIRRIVAEELDARGVKRKK